MFTTLVCRLAYVLQALGSYSALHVLRNKSIQKSALGNVLKLPPMHWYVSSEKRELPELFTGITGHVLILCEYILLIIKIELQTTTL